MSDNLFTALNQSPFKEPLCEYLLEEQKKLCDVRNMKEGETPESTRRIVAVLQTLIDKISMKRLEKLIEKNIYE